PTPATRAAAAHCRQAGRRRDLAAQPLAAGDVSAVEARESDALEVGVLEAEGLAVASEFILALSSRGDAFVKPGLEFMCRAALFFCDRSPGQNGDSDVNAPSTRGVPNSAPTQRRERSFAMTVYAIAQLKMNDRAAYDRYQARFFEVFRR